MTMKLFALGSRAIRKVAWMAGLTLATMPLAALQASEHGAHTHGVSQLDIALSGKDLEMAFAVPGADVVGFEHPARSPEEKSAVSAAAARLKKGGTLFLLPDAARCRLTRAEVLAAGLWGDHDEAHHGASDHQEGDHAHKKDPQAESKAPDHDHGQGEKEARHEHHEERDGGHHAEFTGQYRFHCENPNRLDSIEIKAFKIFPSITRINARVLTPSGQSAKALTPASSRLDF